MKLGLPLKLAILVVVIFGVTIAACLLFRPLRLRWYESKLDSDDVQTRRRAAEKLLTLGPDGREIAEELVLGKDIALIETIIGKPGFSNIDYRVIHCARSSNPIGDHESDPDRNCELNYPAFFIHIDGSGKSDSIELYKGNEYQEMLRVITEMERLRSHSGPRFPASPPLLKQPRK
ncbi:MAG: hypothetical protein ACYS8W_03075 [Planctomycetota bacterium]|jgi:hypothetical protein